VGGLNVALNLIFIPRFGTLAAAWTTLASYILLFLIHTAIVHFRLRVRYLFPLKQMFAFGVGMVTFISLWQML
jgi:O-antigen/teichoic acid export membrane protein